MPLGNEERSLFDEFWALRQGERPVDLEQSEPRDLWDYDDKKPISFSAETHDYCFTPCCYDPTPQNKADPT